MVLRSPARTAPFSYSEAGVASSEEMRSFGSAIDLFRSTAAFPRSCGPPADLGGLSEPYASVLDLSKIAPNLALALATDGVGTKLLVAEALGKYDTAGIDCVAMNANDILCVGAEPIAMVDYIAVKSTDTDQLRELAEGLVEGARQAHVSIPGGETAQVAEMLAGGDKAFDLVGTCAGTVALDKVIVGREIAEGDAIIGYASTGIHANGLTLARRVFERAGWGFGRRVPEFGRTLGEELLEPTAIYVDLALALREALDVHAFAHITSDGFINLTRVPSAVAQKAGFAITALPETPPVFELIRRLGVRDEELFRVFNMGVGFCAVVPEAAAEQAIALGTKHGHRATRLGGVTADQPGRVTIHADGIHLRSHGKQFERIA